MGKNAPVKLVQPHQLAWLRRPELDTEKADIWERPDGSLFCHPKGQVLMLQIVKGKLRA